MRGLLAQLSPHEETTLRRVALGFGDAAPSMHIKQLEKLALIERRRSEWRLTPLGEKRYEQLERPAKLSRDDGLDWIAGFLSTLARDR